VRARHTRKLVTLCDFLTAHFADVLAEDYTARLESQLDRITAGEARTLDVLRAFWTDFQPQLQRAAAASTPKPLTLRPLEVSDVYANANTGDLGASYLPIAAYDDPEQAAAHYADLLDATVALDLPVYDLPQFVKTQVSATGDAPARLMRG